jgi:hypothetical protein
MPFWVEKDRHGMFLFGKSVRWEFPQRSILSVALLSIKINSLAKALNDNIEGSLYVDDFLICYRGKNMNIIERQLQIKAFRIKATKRTR